MKKTLILLLIVAGIASVFHFQGPIVQACQDAAYVMRGDGRVVRIRRNGTYRGWRRDARRALQCDAGSCAGNDYGSCAGNDSGSCDSGRGWFGRW